MGILFELLYKYVIWADFNWCDISYDSDLDTIKVYDVEEHKYIPYTKLINYMFENGMLNECFSKIELGVLKQNLPAKYKKEIDYYE